MLLAENIFHWGILIFKGLTVQRLYKSFGVKGLTCCGQAIFFGVSELVSMFVVKVH
jgi:hypothetical protein